MLSLGPTGICLQFKESLSIFADCFIEERHTILKNSIGTLKMENIAYNQAWIFSWIFHVIVILCSILQYVCFNLYNEKYHPMAMILKETKISQNGTQTLI